MFNYVGKPLWFNLFICILRWLKIVVVSVVIPTLYYLIMTFDIFTVCLYTDPPTVRIKYSIKNLQKWLIKNTLGFLDPHEDDGCDKDDNKDDDKRTLMVQKTTHHV